MNLSIDYTNNQLLYEPDYTQDNNLKSFKEEVKDNVASGCQGKNNIILLFSGGMDSCFLALTLKELGITFKAITYTGFAKLVNTDTIDSIEFCKTHNINQEIVYISSDELVAFAISKKNNNIYRFAINQYLIDMIMEKYPDSFFVGGVGFELKHVEENLAINWPVEFLNENQNKFLSCMSDRAFFAYINNPIIKNNYRNIPNIGKQAQFMLRGRIYSEAYPEIFNSGKIAPSSNWVEVMTSISLQDSEWQEKIKKNRTFKAYLFNLTDYYNSKG